MRHNPDWKVRFYYPKYPTKDLSWVSFEHKFNMKFDDYYDKIFDLPIETIKVDFEDWFNMPNTMSEVHKSDLLRWQLLQEGGLWSDMDIIYFNSVNELSINTDDNEYVDTAVCYGRYGHSIGFLMGSDGNKIYEAMLKQALIDYAPEQYQGIGSTLMNRVVTDVDADNIANISMNAVYHYDALNINKIFDNNPSPMNVPGAIGCHWYAGHPLAGEFISKTNGGKEKLPKCVLSDLIKQ